MDQLTERKEQEKSVENKDKGTDWFFGNIRDAAQFLTGCWMFLMLTIFPLYFGNKYHEIGGYKFSFFLRDLHSYTVPRSGSRGGGFAWENDEKGLRRMEEGNFPGGYRCAAVYGGLGHFFCIE